MKPLFVKVALFDPITGSRYPIKDDIDLDVVPLEGPEGTVEEKKLLPLTPDEQTGVFRVDAPAYRVSPSHHLRVRFLKPNYSVRAGRLLAPDEVRMEDLPVYCPSRLPYWDTGWADYYSASKYFGRRDLRVRSTPEGPLALDVPIREVFIIGHRGAPMHYPENTMASFAKALELGSNGLELDLCLTRDEKIAIFHDPMPIRYPGRLDRTLFEKLPYPLVSPVFDSTGREVSIGEWKNGAYVAHPPRPLASEDEFDVINLTLEQLRSAYSYELVDGQPCPIPTLEEFLQFASENTERLRFVVFDMKNPRDHLRRRTMTRFGQLLGATLQRFPRLPQHLVVINERPGTLRRLKAAIRSAGERRCAYAYDASGGLHTVIGVEGHHLIRMPWWMRRLAARIIPWSFNPLAVARRMKNTVVSVGNIMRPAHLREILAAVRDRDYNMKSPIEFIIHWTLNERSQFAESLSAGVNGILTDKPDELRAFLASLDVCLWPSEEPHP